MQSSKICLCSGRILLIVRPGLGKSLLGPFLVCRGKGCCTARWVSCQGEGWIYESKPQPSWRWNSWIIKHVFFSSLIWMFFNLPQIKGKSLVWPKTKLFSLASQLKKISSVPSVDPSPFPIVPPQQSCSMQLYQSWIRAFLAILLLKNLQQESSATCSKFNSAILIKFVNICSYSILIL